MLPSQRYQYNISIDDSVVDGTAPGSKTVTTRTSNQSFHKLLSRQLKDQSWQDALSPYLESEAFQSLTHEIQSDIDGGATVYPPLEDVFAALNLCSLNDIKVVIVGQDPYHQPGQGHGLAFSVQKASKIVYIDLKYRMMSLTSSPRRSKKGVTPPPSLKNIFKEAIKDVGIQPPQHGNLESWARQGVLLLNTVLTVRRGEANSHAKLGWEGFTDFVIQIINDQAEPVVFLLWGSPAAKKASHVDEGKHVVIRTSHPR